MGYYERPPRTSVAPTEAESNEDPEMPPIDLPIEFGIDPPQETIWENDPQPLYLSREFVDPLDPKYSVRSTLKNVRERKRWLENPIVRSEHYRKQNE
ncbi:hypothetical protein BGZ76_003067 [Entomortierella beljakovae]|nr:hypothetical protein BGZ76_003067 [Entomortierella beljakovae]